MKNRFYILLFFILSCNFSFAQNAGNIAAVPIVMRPVATETVDQIMNRAKYLPDVQMIDRAEMEEPDRSNLPQNPLSNSLSSFPQNLQLFGNTPAGTNSPQTLGTSFNAVTGPTETGAFPPDDMGSIGPTQFVVFVNGRIRSFNKSTGGADGILNLSPDVFFASVMTPIDGVNVKTNFTSDPRIRYDRLSGKWIMIIIDVPGKVKPGDQNNRILLAYSNTSTITGSTTWTFSEFTGQTGYFLDYPTLGIDINALYIGGNVFTLAGAYNGTNGYVINRSTFLSGGAVTVYAFTGLATSSGAGPYTPQGVDNFDASATEGYFIGVDNISYGLLQMRRVSTPAGVPTISGNLSVTVNSTALPQTVPHLGNTGGTNGQLAAIDDRLFAAMSRNGNLWTAHNISVDASGVAATSGTVRRNGARWYNLNNLTSTPSLVQSGTIFDPLPTASNPLWYYIPSVMVSGQGHAAFALTTAGNAAYSNAATVGRLSGDAPGTTQTAIPTTASATAYNPSGDPGGSGGRRWGDYSYVSLDPLDDMTMWMINQYCVGSNLYGCNVTKLIAPPPASPTTCNPLVVAQGQSSVNVVVTGTVVSGSGFYDPGTNLPSPALAFSHITGSISGSVTVNSVTYTSPTSVTLNISTVGSPVGVKNVTITNPDGQSLTGTGILTVTIPLPIPSLTNLLGKLNSNQTITLSWSTSSEINNKGFYIERTETNNPSSGWTDIAFVNGAGNSSATTHYSFVDNNIVLNNIYTYRLKELSLDGSFAYSNEIVIRINKSQNNNLQLLTYPNPFKSTTSFKYIIPNNGIVSLKVYDIMGKEVATVVNAYQLEGVYVTSFTADNLSKSIYFCKLTFGGETITNRIILIQ